MARERFGHPRLRPGQEEALQAVLAGRDALAVMPTGYGKSLVYQLAGLLVEGPTVVVSPLIALQRDQTESLARDGIPAAELNSGLSEGRREEVLAALADRSLEFLFLAPEQLGNDETFAALRRARPTLFVVDEAHCVSEWGHDFRPDYLRLGAAVEELGHPRVLALTATAAPPVRQEIAERLGLRDPVVVVRGFDRPNIWLGVERFHDETQKEDELVDRVADASKPGIVYVATRKASEETAAALRERGVRARPYHAGLRKRERDEAQEAFMADEVEVIVSTVAFGLGVDKPNVRFVFHRDVSDSVDSYYQELGRAGRDGKPATALLFYRPEDVGLRRFFAGTSTVDADDVQEVAEAIAERAGPVDPEALAAEEQMSGDAVAGGMRQLEEVGAVRVLPSGEVEPREALADPEATAREAVRSQERRAEWARSRVEMMRGYAELKDCRREYVLNYFGEEFEAPCGKCDNCEAGVVQADTDAPFPLGTRVEHGKWGEGTVQRYESDKLVVLFDDAGYKTLAVELVREGSLLEPL
ncbi:MAG: ATP-dependent DNA helicase [Actinomycetota bacterium]|nr:ATP-dependent DNA helicase [Actinomycetota bacterium]